MGDVVFVALLVMAVATTGLDLARSHRSWQLVVCGLGFVALAFGSLLSVWVAPGCLVVLAFLADFLRRSAPRPVHSLPRQREVLSTPEPASNLRVL